jgi:hypothetical protein
VRFDVAEHRRRSPNSADDGMKRSSHNTEEKTAQNNMLSKKKKSSKESLMNIDMVADKEQIRSQSASGDFEISAKSKDSVLPMIQDNR